MHQEPSRTGLLLFNDPVIQYQTGYSNSIVLYNGNQGQDGRLYQIHGQKSNHKKIVSHPHHKTKQI